MSEVLIKLTGLWERRRGNLGKHVLDQPCSRRREKTWHEMIRAVLRGGPLSGEPPKFKAAANMRSSR